MCDYPENMNIGCSILTTEFLLYFHDFAAICQDGVFERFDVAHNTPEAHVVEDKDTIVELPW